jgi:hypothetical protein
MAHATEDSKMQEQSPQVIESKRLGCWRGNFVDGRDGYAAEDKIQEQSRGVCDLLA